MRYKTWLAIVFPFLLVPSAELQAGDPPVTVGDRIRIRTPSPDPHAPSALFQKQKVSILASEPFLVGRVMEIENGEIVVRAEGGPPEENVTIEGLNRLEVWSHGTYRTTGTILGLLAGSVAGGFIGQSLAKEEPANPHSENWGLDFSIEISPSLQGVFVGSIVGGVFGFVVGSEISREYWRRVEVPGLGVRVAANLRNNVGLACSVSF